MAGRMKLTTADRPAMAETPWELENLINFVDSETAEELLSNFPPQDEHVLSKLSLFLEFRNPTNVGDYIKYFFESIFLDESQIGISIKAISYLQKFLGKKRELVVLFRSNDVFERLYQKLFDKNFVSSILPLIFDIITSFQPGEIDFLEEHTIRQYFDFFQSTDQVPNIDSPYFIKFVWCMLYNGIGSNLPKDLVEYPLPIMQRNIQNALNDRNYCSEGLTFVLTTTSFNFEFTIPDYIDRREDNLIMLMRISCLKNYPALITFEEFFNIFQKYVTFKRYLNHISNFIITHHEDFTEEQTTLLGQFFYENHESFGFPIAKEILYSFSHLDSDFIWKNVDFLEILFNYGLTDPDFNSLIIFKCITEKLCDIIKSNDINYLIKFQELVNENLEAFEEFATISNLHETTSEIILNIFNNFES